MAALLRVAVLGAAFALVDFAAAAVFLLVFPVVLLIVVVLDFVVVLDVVFFVAVLLGAAFPTVAFLLTAAEAEDFSPLSSNPLASTCSSCSGKDAPEPS